MELARIFSSSSTLSTAFPTGNPLQCVLTTAEKVTGTIQLTVPPADPNDPTVFTGLTDPNGNPSGIVYDEANRLASNTRREDGVTQYQYDNLDRIIQVTATNGAVTRYEYDMLVRRTKEISPDRGTLTYAYDLANNVTSITDGRGITATLTNDELERVATKTYPMVIFCFCACRRLNAKAILR